jgi:hypothetical protein
VGGTFTSFDGITRPRIVRLEPDGTLDPSFESGKGAERGWSSSPDYALVDKLLLMSDGRLLIGGSFSRINGHERPSVARLFAYTPLSRDGDCQNGPTPAHLLPGIWRELPRESVAGRSRRLSQRWP